MVAFSFPFPSQGLGSVLFEYQDQAEATPGPSLLSLFPEPGPLRDSEGSVLKAPWEGRNDRERGQRNWGAGKGWRPGFCTSRKGQALGVGTKTSSTAWRQSLSRSRAPGTMRVNSPQKCSFSGRPPKPPGFWVALTKREPIITTMEFPPHQARWGLRVGTELISEAFLALWGCGWIFIGPHKALRSSLCKTVPYDVWCFTKYLHKWSFRSLRLHLLTRRKTRTQKMD